MPVVGHARQVPPLVCVHPSPSNSSAFIKNHNHVKTMLTLGQLGPAAGGQDVDEDRDVDIFVFLACLKEFLQNKDKTDHYV